MNQDQMTITPIVVWMEANDYMVAALDIGTEVLDLH